jgi:ABC-type multidrug transport system fused ATPase/permease subunit
MESGRHEQLVQKNGWYARMYRLQMDGGALVEELVD